MNKKLFWTSIAFGVAAVLFFITLQMGSSRKQQETFEAIKPLDAWHESSQTQQVGAADLAKQVGRYVLEYPGKHGSFYQISGESIKPLPQGVLEVEKPKARIHLKRNRTVIEIQADRGTFIAPGNRPQSGSFEGHVTLVLFEGPDYRNVDMSANSPDASLLLKLDEARFDLQLGQIQSDGPVHLIGKRMEFVGENLDLIYNDLHDRLDRLEIAKGKWLRLRQDDGQNPFAKTGLVTAKKSAAAVAKASSTPSGNTKIDSNTNAISADFNTTANGQEMARPSQIYRATFHDNVKVTQTDKVLLGETLTAFLGIQFNNGRSTLLHSAATKARGSGGVGGSGGEQTKAVKGDATDVLKESGLQQVALDHLTPLPNDVLVYWTGNLLIEPEAKKPAGLIDAKDVLLEIEGRPLHIVSGKDQTLVARTLTYHARRQKLLLKGDDAYPLLMSIAKLGELDGHELEINLGSATGQFVGAGSLRTIATPDKQLSRQTFGQADSVLGSAIYWRDRVDLLFYTKKEKDSTSGIASLRGAIFHGQTRVENDDFDLKSDLVSVYLKPCVASRQAVDSLSATGHVKVATRTTKADKQVTIESDYLVVALTVDDKGETKPARLIAKKNVIAHRQGQTIKSDLLTVHLLADQVEQQHESLSKQAIETQALDKMLAQANAAVQDVSWGDEDTSKTHDAKSILPREIREIVAEKKVEIILDKNDLHVFADKIVANEQQVEITASKERFVRIVRGDGMLRSHQVVLDPATQTLHALGQGTLAFYATQPSDKLLDKAVMGRTLPQNKGEDRPMFSVDWQDNMHFYSQSGIAQFFGQVHAQGINQHDTTQVDADAVVIEFYTFDLPAKNNYPNDTTQDAQLKQNFASTAQRIRTVTATGGVTFLEESWASKKQDQLLTRVRLAGPRMEFDNLIEQLKVVGPGTLLFQDHRPDKSDKAGGNIGLSTKSNTSTKTQAHSKNKTSKSQAKHHASGVEFTGRGSTLFHWVGQLMMDIVHNDMKISDQVQMLYLPENASDQVQMDCDQFIADLESTGGLGAWMGAKSPKPALKAVLANKQVRVLYRNRELYTDHLEYTGFDQTIELRADDGKLSQVLSKDGISSASAKVIRWNLSQDRLEIQSPGRTMMPRR